MNNKPKYNPATHRRRSIRLQGYDYSQAGLYFITICTHNREYLFGDIIDGKMILNDCGKIANEYWLKIPEHFSDAVLHEHIVMPNHVHGIIELVEAAAVGVQNFKPLQPSPQSQPLLQNQFQHIIPRSIGSIIRGYKIGVTKYFRTNTDIHQVWQRNFHEHVIMNEQSYWRISDYIITNPDLWENDRFNTEGSKG